MKQDYFAKISDLFLELEVTDKKARPLALESAVLDIKEKIIASSKRSGQVILIGNGGSASIANHIATDFLKNSGVLSLSFSDASLLTCISNDFGYEHVFQKPLELILKKRDVLIAISSSGKSENILRAVKEAEKKGSFLVTLSGFDRKNPLKKTGNINFYVPSYSYGYVEIIHLAVCHYIAEQTAKR